MSNEPSDAELKEAAKFVSTKLARLVHPGGQTFYDVATDVAKLLAAHRADSESELAKAGVTQESIRKLYQERGYTSDLNILALGLSEECGEVCASILDLSSEYKPKPNRVKSDLAHELKDALTYLYAIANASGINLTTDSDAENLARALRPFASEYDLDKLQKAGVQMEYAESVELARAALAAHAAAKR